MASIANKSTCLMTGTNVKFSKLELIEDNYGHSWSRANDIHNYIIADIILRPGDLLIFKVTAESPLAEEMYYNFQFGYKNESCWQKEPYHTFEVTETHINPSIAVYIRLSRKFRDSYIHLEENDVQFRYTVLEKEQL